MAPVTAPTWPEVLAHLVAGNDLDQNSTAWAMDQAMRGAATPVQLAGFLVALRTKGETVAELSGLTEAMLAHAVRFEVPGRSVDIVGTGGDRANTVNISTMAALVVAGAGLRVIKHGNRAASSKSGSADVLEALGVKLDHSVETVQRLAEEVGITFCFAMLFHPAMRHAGQARSELGIATAFNFLGPLTNPAQPTATAVGCADLRMAPLLAGVFARRGTNALVFRGEDGLDELAPTAPSRVWEVSGTSGEITEHLIDSVTDLGLAPARISDLRGDDAQFNANVAREVLAGRPGPVRDAVVLNAAAALTADGSQTGEGTLIQRLQNGIELAGAAIDSGAAANVLERWANAS
ncbi:MAG TPA: anthranilate phosphoribosyltransferase [Actinomycetales bacterium]|nr:anthranilate phosphoribosyltransferase [Actinomycetales bacterium]